MYHPVASCDGDLEEMQERRPMGSSSGPNDDASRPHHSASWFRRGVEKWKSLLSDLKCNRNQSRHIVCLTLIIVGLIVLMLWPNRGQARQGAPVEDWQQPRRRYLGRATERGPLQGTQKVADLLKYDKPTLSFYDNLKSDMRYLMCDSWSGLGGQFTTVLPLLLLASMTSRIAILPSFNDELHYGKGVIMKMSLLYDLDRFREMTGILVVEQDDVKYRDPNHNFTKPDEIGCYHASPWFNNALSYGDHNMQQVEIQVERQKIRASGTGNDFHYESFVLFDADFDRRMEDTIVYLKEQGRTPERFPPNIASETPSSSLLCYTNLWNLERAGHEHVSEAQRKMMAPIWSGYQPEWYFVGRYIDFAPRVWEIALDSVRTTLGVTQIPQELITMHIRRGDFLTWCPMQVNCVPTLDAFASALDDLRSELSQLLPDQNVATFPVLVTTDERENLPFLDEIKYRGWIISETPSTVTEQAFGEGWKWADSAIAQAILSLGRRGFVGTSNSQVSQLTQLRIQTYYHQDRAPTRMVDREGKWT